MHRFRFGFMTVVLLAMTGCGTVHNLQDPPGGPLYIATGSCYPFGGVVRSGMLAVMGPRQDYVEWRKAPSTSAKESLLQDLAVSELG